MFNLSQKTIDNSINCNSVGLHSGCNINMRLLPAEINTGIIFRRTDLESGKNEIKANFKNSLGCKPIPPSFNHRLDPFTRKENCENKVSAVRPKVTK